MRWEDRKTVISALIVFIAENLSLGEAETGALCDPCYLRAKSYKKKKKNESKK